MKTKLEEKIEERFSEMSKGKSKKRIYRIAILEELSNLLKISKSQLYALRIGRSDMSLSQAVKIADYFDCAIEELVFDEDEALAA